MKIIVDSCIDKQIIIDGIQGTNEHDLEGNGVAVNVTLDI